jgi:hypothetical protein
MGWSEGGMGRVVGTTAPAMPTFPSGKQGGLSETSTYDMSKNIGDAVMLGVKEGLKTGQQEVKVTIELSSDAKQLIATTVGMSTTRT